MIKLFERLYHDRFIRFGFIGGLGFFVNEAALIAAHQGLHAGPHLSWLIAFIPSVTFTWWGNRRLTFADRKSHGLAAILTEWGKFVLANSFGALVNFVTYALLINFAPAPLNLPPLALVAGVLMGLIFNFTLSARLVFRRRAPEADRHAPEANPRAPGAD